MSWSRIYTVAIAFILILGMHTFKNAVAGEGSDQIKTMLLRPGGWIVEWRGETYEEVSDFIFEARGEKVVVKIKNAAWSMTCEREVTITSEVVELDGCWDKNITLQFDPNDSEYPFKGESQKVKYKLKPK